MEIEKLVCPKGMIGNEKVQVSLIGLERITP